MREAQRHPCRPVPSVRLVGWMFLVLTAAGCAGKYTPVQVSGVVTLDGKPVEGATVNFYAVGDEREGRMAFGTTDKAGAFQLSTMGNGDGALRRDYKVVIYKNVPTNPNLKVPDFPDTVEGNTAKANFFYQNYEAKGIQPFKNALPERYGDPKTTPLSFTVTGPTTTKFELTSKPPK